MTHLFSMLSGESNLLSKLFFLSGEQKNLCGCNDYSVICFCNMHNAVKSVFKKQLKINMIHSHF